MEIRDLLPVIFIQLAVQLTALSHLIYKKKTRNLNVWAWAGIIILGQLLGAFLYFFIGRDDE